MTDDAEVEVVASAIEGLIARGRSTSPTVVIARTGLPSDVVAKHWAVAWAVVMGRRPVDAPAT